jgi:hypothetical protein
MLAEGRRGPLGAHWGRSGGMGGRDRARFWNSRRTGTARWRGGGATWVRGGNPSSLNGLNRYPLAMTTDCARRFRCLLAPSVVCTLERLGVRFEGAGFVLRADGAMAPSRVAVGIFHGARIRKARWHLGWTQEHLAGLANTTVRVLREMENSRNLNATPSLVFYRALAELQLAGMVFGPKRHGGRRGDYCLVPRPIRWQGSRPLRDYAVATVSRPKGPPIDAGVRLDCIDEPIYRQGGEPKVQWPKDLEQQARAGGDATISPRKGAGRG